MRLLIVAVALTSCMSTAHAQTVTTKPAFDAAGRVLNALLYPTKWADVAKLDLAGVRLGMTPSEVRQALIAKGFKPRSGDRMMPSWGAQLATKAADRGVRIVDQSTVSQMTAADGPQGDNVEVWYVATPNGAKASFIDYSLSFERMDRAAFIKNVEARYGQATRATARKLIYCVKNDDTCGSLGDMYAKGNLIADTYVQNTIQLREGTAAQEARKVALLAELDAKAPKTAKASF